MVELTTLEGVTLDNIHPTLSRQFKAALSAMATMS